MALSKHFSLDITRDLAFECANDPKICRFMQDRVESEQATREELTRFIDQLLEHEITYLVTGEKGNYLVSGIIRACSSSLGESKLQAVFQKLIVNIPNLIIDKHGCRVI